MTDLPYNGEPPSQKHSDTSKAAAKSIKYKVGPLHKRVLDALYLWHPLGMTDEEMERALNLSGNTLRPRRRELQLMGRIVDSGNCRKTRSGRDAVVWRLV